MQASLTSLINPKWANAEHTLIDCIITTSQYGDELLPFTANPLDVENHGKAIFEQLIKGNFGMIAEYTE